MKKNIVIVALLVLLSIMVWQLAIAKSQINYWKNTASSWKQEAENGYAAQASNRVLAGALNYWYKRVLEKEK